jgi:hypothetical protein
MREEIEKHTGKGVVDLPMPALIASAVKR